MNTASVRTAQDFHTPSTTKFFSLKSKAAPAPRPGRKNKKISATFAHDAAATMFVPKGFSTTNAEFLALLAHNPTAGQASVRTVFEPLTRLSAVDARGRAYAHIPYDARTTMVKQVAMEGPGLGPNALKLALGMIGLFKGPIWQRDIGWTNLATLARKWASRSRPGGRTEIDSRKLRLLVDAFLVMGTTSYEVAFNTAEETPRAVIAYPAKPLIGFAHVKTGAVLSPEAVRILLLASDMDDRTLFSKIKDIKILCEGYALWDRHMDSYEVTQGFERPRVKAKRNMMHFPDPYSTGMALAEIRAHCLMTAFLPYKPNKLSRGFDWSCFANILGAGTLLERGIYGRFLPSFHAVANLYLERYAVEGANIVYDYNWQQSNFYAQLWGQPSVEENDSTPPPDVGIDPPPPPPDVGNGAEANHHTEELAPETFEDVDVAAPSESIIMHRECNSIESAAAPDVQALTSIFVSEQEDLHKAQLQEAWALAAKHGKQLLVDYVTQMPGFQNVPRSQVQSLADLMLTQIANKTLQEGRLFAFVAFIKGRVALE